MSTTRTQLLDRIARFRARHGLSERQFGIAAVGDHRWVTKLRRGDGVTLTLIERAERFMAEKDEPPAVANGEEAA